MVLFVEQRKLGAREVAIDRKPEQARTFSRPIDDASNKEPTGKPKTIATKTGSRFLHWRNAWI